MIVLTLFACLAQVRSVPSVLPQVDVPKSLLNKKDVTALAGGMMYLIGQEVTTEDAIKKFLSYYKSMGELDESYSIFHVALTNICGRILADKQRFAKVKLLVAAVLSIGDLLTDIR